MMILSKNQFCYSWWWSSEWRGENEWMERGPNGVSPLLLHHQELYKYSIRKWMNSLSWLDPWYSSRMDQHNSTGGREGEDHFNFSSTLIMDHHHVDQDTTPHKKNTELLPTRLYLTTMKMMLHSIIIEVTTKRKERWNKRNPFWEQQHSLVFDWIQIVISHHDLHRRHDILLHVVPSSSDVM